MKKHVHPHNNTLVQVFPVSPGPVAADGQFEVDNVAGVYARQADELAAMVEGLMRDERERHAKAMRTLQVIAASLGEQHGQLDELATRIEDGEQR